MLIFPAIDLIGGKAVRLLRGDYAQMTVYSDRPAEIALDFRASGAKQMHIVDLEGAKTGETPNFETILNIKRTSGLFCEVGGGIRSIETVRCYLDAGVDRVILGTAAVTEPDFAARAVREYGEKIAVGVDLKDRCVAVKGWTETSQLTAVEFCRSMRDAGVRTIICTDISRDGAMRGTNLALYGDLSAKFDLNFVASGGVSSMDDVRRLRQMNLYGAIIGKAYYTGAVNLKEAVEAAI